MMKWKLALQAIRLCSLLGVLSVTIPAHAQNQFYEPWKGKTVTSPFELGVLSGANLYGKDVNWSVLFTGAYLINEEGWAQDLDDRVWVELEMGPSFFSVPGTLSNEAGLQYSAHLRWDFTYNEYWTLYALGGIGGFSLPASFGSTNTIHPRFGVGAQYQTKAALMFRAEISAEFMGAGIGFNF
jgi:hypothetical protein